MAFGKAPGKKADDFSAKAEAAFLAVSMCSPGIRGGCVESTACRLGCYGHFKHAYYVGLIPETNSGN